MFFIFNKKHFKLLKNSFGQRSTFWIENRLYLKIPDMAVPYEQRTIVSPNQIDKLW